MREPNDASPLSRGEVEKLCILHVVGEDGCPADELAGRLGLSDSLAAAIAAGTEPLVQAGLLTIEDDWLDVTDAGRALLAARLRELGLDGR
jgi:hypothetical protein